MTPDGFALAAFILLLSQAMARKLEFSCGCFGRWDPLGHHPAWAILRDAAFLACAVVCYRAPARAQA